jgi:hypothetical protein
MAKAIFHIDFNYTPKGVGKSWCVKASEKPQTLPQLVIDAAVKRGVAKIVKPKKGSGR